jgi:cation-transporting ATPase E
MTGPPGRSDTTVPGRSGPEAVRVAGLTSVEVAERRARGAVNVLPTQSSRSYREIVRANTLTRFNAVVTALAVVVLLVGSPIDALFAGVMVANTVIGVVQEVRAKRTLDRLNVLIAPTVGVVRDGTLHRTHPSDLVIDDVVVLAAGDQVPVDGTVLDGDGLEVDESALTGEPDAIRKRPGDEVLSGSVVVAGSASVVAARVGQDVWIHRLLVEAKHFALTQSELRRGVDRILQVVSWMIVPVAALLLWSQLRGNADVADGLVSAVAGVVGLVPQGLVLLVSLALAVAVVRLAAEHVVVQELPAVEGLARVDTLCLDKTGTLTTGRVVFDHLEPVGAGAADEEVPRRALAALAAAESAPTSTTLAVRDALSEAPAWTPLVQVAFSSERKWSGTTFAGEGSWLLGAPEVLLGGLAPEEAEPVVHRVTSLAADARRVVLLARSDAALDPTAVEAAGGGPPRDARPVALVVFGEQLRADAAETLSYFARQNVDIRIISGDNPVTVSALARAAGVEGAGRWVDMRTEVRPPQELVDGTVVFGRVLPEQKRDLVLALQRAGRTVAMTGDGVNDIPALKKADIGIAMDTATAATKAVAQLVLLDGRFDRLPHVVGEGRRVVANMERVSSLFVAKTVYSTLFALVIGVSGSVFPFLPRHMSLVSELTIGVPAFILSFRYSSEPCRPGYLRRVLRFAAPAGVAVASATLVAYGTARGLFGVSVDEARTTATMALVVMGLVVLVRLVAPLTDRTLLLVGALAAVALVVFTVPPVRRFYALELPDVTVTGVAAGAVVVVTAVWHVVDRRVRRSLDRAREAREQVGGPPG